MTSKRDLTINKGVELMLRREKTEPKRNGLRIFKSFSLLKNNFQIKFEFTWGE
jgi:hypothetical protein